MIRNAALFILVLIAASAAPAFAGNHGQGDRDQAPGHPACLPDPHVVDNDEVRIWFQGAKSQLKLFKKNQTTNGIDGMYQYKALSIDELGEDNQTLASMTLENAEPQHSECEVTREDEWVNITYTATESVKDAEGGFLDETATFQFIYHFNTSDNSAKFDLNLTDWPWQSDSSELAYAFEVESGWLIEPAENGLGFRDTQTGEAEAFIEWAPNATATYEDDSKEEAIVDADTTGTDHHTVTTLRFTNATAGYENLWYDPTVASGPYLIVADLLIPVPELPDRIQRLASALI